MARRLNIGTFITWGRAILNSFDVNAKALFQYDMFLAIQAGLIPNMSAINKFGQNVDIDQGGKNVIWDNGAVGVEYPYLSDPTVLTVSSSNPSDTVGDAGSDRYMIKTLDTGKVFASGDFTLNGQTGVEIGSQWRVYRAENISANLAMGTVYVGYGTVTNGIPVTILAKIMPEDQKSKMAIMTVPSGHIGLMKYWDGDINKKQGTLRSVELHIESRREGQQFRTRDHKSVSDDVDMTRHYDLSKMFEAKEDIQIVALDATADGIDLTSSFDIIFKEME